MAKNENTVKASEMKDRNESELRSLLQSKVDELHKARFKQALGQLRQTHTMRVLRRDIARLQTVLTQRAGQAEERA